MEYTSESLKAFIQNWSKYTYVYIDILMSFKFYIHTSKSRYVIFIPILQGMNCNSIYE